MSTSHAVRPRLHLTAQSGWINDPNGPVVIDGVYHLFFQHYPDGPVWGPMHWGHATSRDLLVWQHLPVVLRPDDQGSPWSGSAVLDDDGSGGFGAGALIAAYTYSTADRQEQHLAISTDRGRTLRPLDENPVLPCPEGIRDFRDPRLLRLGYGPATTWLMPLVAGDHALIYTSRDLRRWTRASEMRAPTPVVPALWETPDLFMLPVEGTEQSRWVFTVSVQSPGSTQSGTVYWTGEFDGATFTPDEPVARWVDHGADFYAPQTWSNEPSGRTLWIAWAGNWAYAAQTPGEGWRGTMTIPRSLALLRDSDRLSLAQGLPASLDSFFSDQIPASDDGQAGWQVPSPAVLVRASLPPGAPLHLTMRGELGEVGVSIDGQHRYVVVDRGLATGGLSEGFATTHEAPLRAEADDLDVTVLVDAGIVEVLADSGRTCLTSLAWLGGESMSVEVAESATSVSLHLPRSQ